jgi:hypothetical protein
MIEALIHRKLTFRQENMEDILTSNVFGMLQYAPPESGLFPFLARATTADERGNEEYPLRNLLDGQGAAEYEFWPNWQIHRLGSEKRVQPDLALRIRRGNGVSYLVAVEAKYHSGKSSEAGKGEEEETEEDVSLICADQLAKEWIALVEEAKRQDAKPILIYLTADYDCPREQIGASLSEHRVYQTKYPDVPEPLVCWLSWRELANLSDEAAGHPILLAVARMVKEMGLTFFRGITEVAPLCVTWRFRPPPRKWQFCISQIVFQWSFQDVDPQWSFQTTQITCQWRFQEPTAVWHFQTALIVSPWRFKR